MGLGWGIVTCEWGEKKKSVGKRLKWLQHICLGLNPLFHPGGLSEVKAFFFFFWF